MNTDESFKLQCTKCGKTKDYEPDDDDQDEDFEPCDFCENITCIECVEKGYYLYAAVCRAGGRGICSFCFKSDGPICYKSSVYYSDWKKLHIKYKKLKEEKNTYIKQLEEEIKLLKAMVDFQPGGEGYLAASDHFKRLIGKIMTHRQIMIKLIDYDRDNFLPRKEIRTLIKNDRPGRFVSRYRRSTFQGSSCHRNADFYR